MKTLANPGWWLDSLTELYYFMLKALYHILDHS